MVLQKDNGIKVIPKATEINEKNEMKNENTKKDKSLRFSVVWGQDGSRMCVCQDV